MDEAAVGCSQTIDLGTFSPYKENNIKQNMSKRGVMSSFFSLLYLISRGSHKESDPSTGRVFSFTNSMQGIFAQIFLAGSGRGLVKFLLFVTQAYILPRAVDALRVANLALFSQWIIYASAAYLGSLLVQFLIFNAFDKLRNKFSSRIKIRMFQNLLRDNNILHADFSPEDWMESVKERLHQTLTHIPVIIGMIVATIGSMVLASTALNLSTFVFSLFICVLTSFVGRWVKVKFEKHYSQYVERYDNTMTHSARNIQNAAVVNLSHQAMLNSTVRTEVNKTSQLSLTATFYNRIKIFASGILSHFTYILYTCYFAGCLYFGYLTLPTVLILLPLCKSLSESMGEAVGIIPLTLHTLKVANKLYNSWQLVSKGYDVLPDYESVKLTRNQLRILFSALCLLSPLMLLISLKAMIVFLMGSCVLVVFEVRSKTNLLSMILCKRPSVASKPSGVQVSVVDVSDAKKVEGVFENEKGAKTDFEIHTGQAHFVSGENGSGKSSIFSKVIPCKLPRMGQNIKFGKGKSWVVAAADLQLLSLDFKSDGTILERLAQRYSVKRDQAFDNYVIEGLSSCGFSRLDLDKSYTDFSDGERQVLAICGLVATLKLYPNKASYVCCDEMTGKIDSAKRPSVLQYLGESLTAWQGTSAVIDHNVKESDVKAHFQQQIRLSVKR
ncbi:hypothetical protein MMH89_01050 [Candidatus Comchoanobacter bicostacola]|uniref:ABC transmembrane type-1 domain-containing protein n=1 Tax=Candidatus Comchoanobacter bicostacola TaxID=2919598 RepID=A0ABY5DLA0_9GAMM|nr:ATP-binding cassette domain-containing protein [Candidatus Comchoanobacter bicostacola]UTC24743.1 hypothetical protein MMH89_01050 [Candidatus Comchoanobacter bicostacola]